MFKWFWTIFPLGAPALSHVLSKDSNLNEYQIGGWKDKMKKEWRKFSSLTIMTQFPWVLAGCMGAIIE